MLPELELDELPGPELCCPVPVLADQVEPLPLNQRVNPARLPVIVNLNTVTPVFQCGVYGGVVVSVSASRLPVPGTKLGPRGLPTVRSEGRQIAL